LGYVVLLNGDFSGKAARRSQSTPHRFFSKDFSQAATPSPQLSAAELKKFTGFYAARAPRNQLIAFMTDLPRTTLASASKQSSSHSLACSARRNR